jgi:hypothetical protein
MKRVGNTDYKLPDYEDEYLRTKVNIKGQQQCTRRTSKKDTLTRADSLIVRHSTVARQPNFRLHKQKYISEKIRVN